MKKISYLFAVVAAAHMTMSLCEMNEATQQLFLACAQNDVALAGSALEHGATVDGPNDDGWLPLHMAAASGSVDVIYFLLDQGALIEQQHDWFGVMALHVAAAHQQLHAIIALLERGADINCRQSYSLSTPLHNAAKLGCIESVKLLLAHGANPTLKDHFGNLPYEDPLGIIGEDMRELLKKAAEEWHHTHAE